MKRTFAVTVAAALAGLLAFSAGAPAAPPPNAGGGGSSGGGGGGGGTPGGGGKTPPEYGDLWILYRNDNGVPYVTPYLEGQGGCVQPLPSADCPEDCITDGVPNGTDVVVLDQALCGVPAECAICPQEVEFERDNVIRAKESVLATQLEDATIKLATAGCVTLDPAGRPVASSVVDGIVASSTIDSPIQNLGFYKKLMQDGYLGLEDGDMDLYADWLTSAARALGGSFAKENEGDKLDMIVYMNEILGLTGPQNDEDEGPSVLCNPCLTQQVREEYMGAMRTVTKFFLNYTGYAYNRDANFANLPHEAYIRAQTEFPQWPAQGPIMDGYFEYALADGLGGSDYKTGPISPTVFDVNMIGDDLIGFAQEADDTRAVINFMHSNPLDDSYVTPIPCANTVPEHFDIFISPRSGLKVPVRMAAAGDGREGSVTVENGGPATAMGVTVMVVGEYWVGGDQKFVQLLDGMGGEPIFTSPMPVDPIEPGYSATIPFFFVMMESADITWTARAYPDDVNAANNVVTKTTIVKKPKGGGGGGGDH